jgi:hypothetical protein
MEGGVTVTPAGSDPAIPSAVADGQGGVLVAWQERTASPYEIRTQWLDQNGNFKWALEGVSMCAITPMEQSGPVLVRSPNRAFVVYQQKNPVPSNTLDLYVQCFDTAGSRLWGEYGAAVCTTVVGDNKNPAAVARGDTSIMVAWEDYRGGSGDIYGSLIINAIPIYVNGYVMCGASGNQIEPVAAREDSGGAIIAWQDYRSGSSDVYAQRITPAGLTGWMPNDGVPVCTLAGDQKELAMTRAAQGKTMLVWTDLRGGAGSDDIYGMMLNSDGSQHWPEAGGRLICGASGEQQAPDVMAHTSGDQFAITWQDRRSGDWDVYALKLDNLAGQVGWEGWVHQQVGWNSRSPKVNWGSPEYLYFAWIDDRNTMGWDVYGQRGRWDHDFFGSVCAPELAEPANMGTIGTDQVAFHWHPSPTPPGAQSYQLHVEDASNPTVYFNANPSDTFVQMTVPAGHSYLWRARGLFNLPPDTSDWSEEWQFSIDTSVPTTPTLIAPPNASHVDSNIVIFEWSLDTSAAMHHIQIDNDMGFSSPLVNDSMIGMPPYGYDFTFEPNGKYFWRVRAGSSAHVWSNWSQTWSVTVDTVPAGVDSTKPANNNNNVPVTSIVRVFFTEPVRTDTSLHFSCQPDPGNWQITQTGSILDFDPLTDLGYGTLYRILLTVRDSAGNQTVVPEFSFTTENITDTVPPRLTVLANGVDMLLGQQFVFECFAKDEHTLNRVHLTYGPAGSGTTSGDVDLNLVPGTDSLWRYTIPANHVSTRGVQYQVWAQDSILAGGLNNVTSFPPNPADHYIHAVSFPGGAYSTTFANDQWLMLSVPGDYTGVSMFDMLADDLGGYDATKWRLFDYQNTTLVEQSAAGSGIIHTGQALWLRQRVSASISLDFQGVHKSYGDRFRSSPAQVPLVPGWSDVGTPLSFDVRWDTTLALSDTSSVAGPYHFNGTSWLLPNQVVTGTVTPYAGFSFRNDRSTNAMLRVPYIQAWKGKGDGEALWPEGWQVRVTAGSGESHDDAWFGIGDGTALGIDRWDFPEPPNGLVPAAGYFLIGDEKCATDLRPELGQGQSWEYELTSDGPAVLEFGLPSGLPDGASVWLLDPVRQSSFQVTEGLSYQYSPEPGEAARRFRLVAGAEEYVHAVLAGAFGLPSATLMEHGRPNPFSQTTTISYQLATGGPVRIAVYNVAGQMVRKLVERTQQPGRYGVRWDGRDDRGQRAANGVYLVRMTAGGVTANQRLTLIR